ncbi:hypothetical protein [Terrimonas ferruginea]|uniref:hypothetical protein n=1 Tax=Terrimonas ferruginea TaxID=249 RepID=UPI000413EF17|nr:hypothetical protein [Terrimonas ferruginea]
MKIATSIIYYLFLLWLIAVIWLGFSGSVTFGYGLGDLFFFVALVVWGIGLSALYFSADYFMRSKIGGILFMLFTAGTVAVVSLMASF